MKATKTAPTAREFWDLGSADINRRATGRGRSPASASSGSAAGPRSLMRVLQILEMLGTPKEGTSLSDICAALNAPRSSTFALLQPLAKNGYLSRSEGRYRLGPKAFALASGILSARDESYLVESTMSHLSEQTAFTVMHTEFLRKECMAVHRHILQSKRSIRYVGSVGIPRPLLTTACGRAMLAFAGGHWTERYLNSITTRPSMRAGSPARRKFNRLLEKVRLDGFASSVGEFDARIGAIAAPILDADGHAIGSISVAGLASEIESEFSVVAPLVRDAGRALSSARSQLTTVPRRRGIR